MTEAEKQVIYDLLKEIDDMAERHRNVSMKAMQVWPEVIALRALALTSR